MLDMKTFAMEFFHRNVQMGFDHATVPDGRSGTNQESIYLYM